MTRHPRRAIALPAALAALVLLSALVAGALFVASEEVRAGRTDLAEQRALAAAERATHETLARWDASRALSLGLGRSSTPDSVVAGPGTIVEVTTTRVARRAIWITARAFAAGDRTGPAARQAIGASFRLVGPAFPRLAALTVAGSAIVADAGAIDGRGVAPPGWEEQLCAESPSESVAGVLAPDTSRICDGVCGGGGAGLIVGDPPKRPDLFAASTAPYESFGDESRAALAARASIMLSAGTYSPAPVVEGAACARAAPLNWGDPARRTPCLDHFPVVHVRGDLTLAAGSAGQGILLVDGDVRLEAGATFTGVLVAGDDIVVSGGGATVLGAAFARDFDGVDGSRVEGGGAVRFSGCAVERAALSAARLEPTPVRWWSELR